MMARARLPRMQGRTGFALSGIYRKVFSDQPEASVRVRVLTLLASLWAAGCLLYVGTPPLIPLLAMPAVALGHAVAYRNLRRRVPLLSVVIAIIIIAAGVWMRHDLVLAIRGERIPVAHFLLISGAASAFEARTRGGLYTQLIFSGLIMLFAAELAFGNDFGVLLAGYLVIVTSFMAASSFTDQSAGATMTWFKGRAAAFGFWGLVGAALVVSSVIAFFVLPWSTSQTPQSEQQAVLPFNGAEGSEEAEMARASAKDLLNSGAGQQTPGGPGTGADGTPAQEYDPSLDWPDSSYLHYDSLAPGETGEGTVAFVRSSVSSYWRNQVFDTYVSDSGGGNERWYSTLPEHWRRSSSNYSNRTGDSEDLRYLQTYFVQQDLGGTILTGYEPRRLTVARDRTGNPDVAAGSTYQVVSARPETSAEALREDRGDWMAHEYDAMPQDSGDIWSLTETVTQGAATDFDKAAAIAAFLQGLEYDLESSSPLASSTNMRDLLAGDAPGSAIDFASAMAIMARAAGLQSRVATGYLPGEYNPYSGANTISSADEHAWAEILFERGGWVPFDASSRPGLPSPDSVTEPPPGVLGSLLEHRLGDNLADAMDGAPQGLRNAMDALMKHGLIIGLMFPVLGAVAALWWWFTHRKRQVLAYGAGLMRYDQVDGQERRRVIAGFTRLEKMLKSSGFRRRGPAESFHQYVNAAQAHAMGHIAALTGLADLASHAAYSASALPEGAATEMRHWLNEVKAAAASRPNLTTPQG
ncbi:MAG: transglutaminase domain-containing protein [Dehalococcoidia bacterium]